MQARKQRLVKPRFQLRLIATFVLISACCSLVQYLLLLRTLDALAVSLPNDGVILMDWVNDLFWKHYALALALMVFMMVSVGLYMTHRIAGPAFRIQTYLTQIHSGEDPGPCRLRNGDEFQEIAELVSSLRPQEPVSGFAEPTKGEPQKTT